MTLASREQVTLADGRVLDVVVAGPAQGTPLVFHHGTPGACLAYEGFIGPIVERGLRFVSYTRPGYGNSTRQVGRSVGDCANDVAELLDQLQAPRFYSLGWSGGGPHALACAALLPERVIGAVSVAGIAPYRAEGLDFLGGMGQENVEEFEAALAGPQQLQTSLDTAAPGLASVTGDDIVAALGGLLSEVDQAALTGELGDFLASNIREGLHGGIWGWFDDDLAFTGDWGFALASISVPTTVWQGHQDRMVPFAHGEWLAAHVTGAQARLEPEHGHLSLAVGLFGRILDDMLAANVTG